MGQTSASRGAIEGWVFDQSGQVLAGARVAAQNGQTGSVDITSTDEHGYFRLTDLPVGSYDVEITSQGFARFEHREITVNLGATTRVDAHLTIATQVQQISVSGQPPVINPSDTSMTSSVGRERIEESPVRTRNALDFVLLEPNVISTNSGRGAASTGAASIAVGNSGFSFGGMRPTANRISIDGMENDDEFVGGSRTELSPEIVEEFQVVNNGMSAEFGGASGGAINVVTRSGANTIHGDAFLFLQNGTLNARPPLEDVRTLPISRNTALDWRMAGQLYVTRRSTTQHSNRSICVPKPLRTLTRASHLRSMWP
jgi:Carboxypeptidase regulatory-like domain/TonB-dependent Receptor Plug Domain